MNRFVSKKFVTRKLLKAGTTGLLVLLFSFSAFSQQAQVQFPDPQKFQESLSNDLLESPSLSQLRDSLSRWARSSQDRLQPVYELEQKTKGHFRLIQLIDSVSYPVDKTSANNKIKLVFDLNQDGLITLLDFLAAEHLVSRIKLEKDLSLGQFFQVQGSVKYSEIHSLVLPLIKQYQQYSSQTVALSQDDQKKFAQIKDVLGNLEHLFWLTNISPEIQKLNQLMVQKTELYSNNPEWRHIPAALPVVAPKDFSSRELVSVLENILESLPNSLFGLRQKYPAIYSDQSEGAFLAHTAAVVQQVLQSLSHKANTSFGLEKFLNQLEQDKFQNQQLDFYPEAYDLSPAASAIKQKENLVKGYDRRVMAAILAQRGGYVSLAHSQAYGIEYYSNWVDLLTELKSLRLEKFWENRNLLIAYANMVNHGDSGSHFVAVQWVSKPTDVLPDYVTARESIAWRAMESAEVESWVSEFATQFYKARVDLAKAIAAEKGFDLEQTRIQIKHLNAQKAELKKSLVGLNENESERVDIEIEAISDLVSGLAQKINSVDSDPRLLQIDTELPKKYAQLKNWPTAHNPARLALIEQYLGLSEYSRKVSLFLDATKDTSILSQLDLNQDGIIDEVDMSLRNLISVIY